MKQRWLWTNMQRKILKINKKANKTNQFAKQNKGWIAAIEVMTKTLECNGKSWIFSVNFSLFNLPRCWSDEKYRCAQIYGYCCTCPMEEVDSAVCCFQGRPPSWMRNTTAFPDRQASTRPFYWQNLLQEPWCSSRRISLLRGWHNLHRGWVHCCWQLCPVLVALKIQELCSLYLCSKEENKNGNTGPDGRENSFALIKEKTTSVAYLFFFYEVDMTYTTAGSIPADNFACPFLFALKIRKLV